jgi:hypothetical protein
MGFLKRKNDDGELPAAIIGMFNNEKEVSEAHAVLTDFGYPKELMTAVSVDEAGVDYYSGDGEIAGRKKDNTSKATATGLIIGVLTGALMGTGFYALVPLNLSSASVQIAWAIAFILVESAVGGLVGASIGAVVGSTNDEEGAKRFEDSFRGGKILVSVTPRTAADALDIARAWKNIGGRLLQH